MAHKLPNRAEMIELVQSLIPEIADDYRDGESDEDGLEAELIELQRERADIDGTDEHTIELDEQIKSLIDDLACMGLTVGWDGKQWGYQTGDNSYTGGAYGFPHWATVTISRSSGSGEIADQILDQIADVMQCGDGSEYDGDTEETAEPTSEE